MAQKRHAGFLARPLAQQARLGIRGAGMGRVAPALPPKVHRRVARIVVRGRRCALLGPEAPGLAAASIRVPSTPSARPTAAPPRRPPTPLRRTGPGPRRGPSVAAGSW